MQSHDDAGRSSSRSVLHADHAEARARSEMRRVLDAAHDGVGIARDGRWTHLNPALARLLGEPSPDALVGSAVLDHVHPADRDVADVRLRGARHSPAPSPGVIRFVRRDGAEALLEVSVTALEGLEGDGAVMLVARDLTERRRRFDRLVAADRGVALAALAASIAHGINTPLAQVYGNASYARDLAKTLLRDLDNLWDAGDSATVRVRLRNIAESVGHLHEGVTAVANITRSLGLFTQRDDEGSGTTTELGRVLEAAIDLTETIIRHRARLTCEIGLMPPVRGSEASLGHLLLSALLASAQAIPEGDAKHHELRVRAVTEGDGARIEITDSGETRASPGDLSDPMAALDRGASPSAFALALCRTLAAAAGGSFDVEPLDPGTRVTIHLVAADGGVSDANRTAGHPAAHEPVRGRVLVIDDEPVMLGLLSKILRLDHDVDGTIDPFEALARIEQGDRYDVILCDLMMPTMSGVELHARIGHFAPHVARRMIFLTAGAFTEKARAFLATGDVTWFEKPIDPERLREIVSERVALEQA
jgi:PAS domain S-box-containing protein